MLQVARTTVTEEGCGSQLRELLAGPEHSLASGGPPVIEKGFGIVSVLVGDDAVLLCSAGAVTSYCDSLCVMTGYGMRLPDEPIRALHSVVRLASG